MNAKMKKRYMGLFPEDIFNAADLPLSVYHRIQVKLLAKIAVARSYSCLYKYKNGWKTLIDQHVAAGHIHPSSFPYLSSSFIIPKSDPTVLSHWVNNYWKLNASIVPDNYPLL